MPLRLVILTDARRSVDAPPASAVPGRLSTMSQLPFIAISLPFYVLRPSVMSSTLQVECHK